MMSVPTTTTTAAVGNPKPNRPSTNAAVIMLPVDAREQRTAIGGSAAVPSMSMAMLPIPVVGRAVVVLLLIPVVARHAEVAPRGERSRTEVGERSGDLGVCAPVCCTCRCRMSSK
jgi:hypothetical protein